jgi:hypothetical protein
MNTYLCLVGTELEHPRTRREVDQKNDLDRETLPVLQRHMNLSPGDLLEKKRRKMLKFQTINANGQACFGGADESREMTSREGGELAGAL